MCPATERKIDFRLIFSLLLLAAAAFCTWSTIEGLAARRVLRTELAEIGHARYDLLNIDRWVGKLLPVLDAQIDALDLKAATKDLKPTVVKALYNLLDAVKDKMAAGNTQNKDGGLMGGANALMANMMMGALRPHVPEYADVVMAELGKPENIDGLKRYMKSVVAGGAKNTFGHVDTKYYDYILQEHGCSDVASCEQQLVARIQADDGAIRYQYLIALGASALAFGLLMIGRPILGRPAITVLLSFCVVLLAGGIFAPMLEVEAKISHLGLTFLGTPISFGDQVVYFQSKSVLEVFRSLVNQGRPDMWIVGLLVLMFSVVFPTIKICTLSLCMFKPALLQTNRLANSSRWNRPSGRWRT
jgi:hypothetical protein